MTAPDEVAAMVRPKALGWGVKRIATELGCSHVTVRRDLDRGGWVAYRTPRRSQTLDGLEDSRTGWQSGSGSIGAVPTWSAGSCWRSTAAR
jgi:hypothetical protein